jgi:hypothetical protein
MGGYESSEQRRKSSSLKKSWIGSFTRSANAVMSRSAGLGFRLNRLGSNGLCLSIVSAVRDYWAEPG